MSAPAPDAHANDRQPPLAELGLAALLDERRWLRRLAGSLVIDAAQADDLTQETLRVALERPPRDARHPRAWLATVVRHLARRFRIAGEQRIARERSTAPAEAIAAADEVVARAELQHVVSAAVLALPEPYRTALLLRFVDDLPPRTIAERLAVPVETVRTRLKRGLGLLREELTRARGRPAREWAVALIGLLDHGTRRAVVRAVASLSKAGTGVGTAAGAAAATTLAVSGALWMSTKLKLAAAAVLVVGGSFAVAKLLEPPQLPRAEGADSQRREAARLAAPADSDPTPLATPVVAERIETPTAAPVPSTAGSVEATVPTTCRVEGRVVDARGAPCPDALVLFEPARAAPRLVPLPAFCSLLDELPHDLEAIRDQIDLPFAITGSDGTFRFDALPATANGSFAALHLEAGMAVAGGTPVDPAHPPAPLELRLIDGVVLSGEVRELDGTPIGGAQLMVMAWPAPGATSGGFSLCSVATGADGRYRSLPLPYRGLSLQCWANDHASEERFPLAIPPDEREHREDFVLARIVAWTGRVVQADGSAAPLRDIARELFFCASSLEPVDDEGDPRKFGGGDLDVANARYSCKGERVEWVSLWCEETLLGKAKLATTGEPGVGPDLVVDLAKIPPPPPRSTLAIEVVDGASGEPVVDFTLALGRHFQETLGGGDAPVRVQGGEAALEFPGLLLGRYEAEVRAEGFVPRLVTLVLDAAPRTAAQRIELFRATETIAGHVVDAQGRPLAGMQVDLLMPDGAVALPNPEYRVVTNIEGAFAFTSITAGTYLLNAHATAREADNAPAPAIVSARAGDRDVRVVMAPALLVTVQIRFPPGIFPEFQKLVRDEAGRPILDDYRPNAWMRCAGNQAQLRLAPGAYTIELLAPNHRCDPVRFVAVDGGEVTVEMVKKPKSR